MKRLVYLLIASIVSYTVLAEEIAVDSNLSEPDIATVSSIHDFCIEQHSELENPDIENFLLSCVNVDLETSAYQLFTSYSQLKSFITLKSGE